MLSELELKVIAECRVVQAAATHMCIRLDQEDFNRSIERGEFPEKSALENTYGIDFFRGIWMEFNEAYFHNLPTEDVNPLKVEQGGWRLISPIIGKYLDQIDQYIQEYPPSEFNEETQNEFLGYVNKGSELLDKLQIISNSYKAKYERRSEQRIQQTEQLVQVLIQELSSRQL